MEPLASTASAALRPLVVSSDASSVLREGRILAAEVLQRTEEGQLVLALGRHRVPAETRLDLDPGQRFLVRVEGEGAGAALHLLGAGDPIVTQLLAALRRVVGEDRPVGELLRSLAAAMRAESARPGGALEELRSLLAVVEGQVLDPAKGTEGLLRLLGSAGLRYEALLLLATRTRLTSELLAGLRSNLKAELLGALERLPDGPVREAIARALGAMEAEQLLNLARHGAGEPTVWSFPFPDGATWATAHLFLTPRADEDGTGPGSEENRERNHLTLALRLSQLGALRADLVLSADVLSVRILVPTEELAARVRADAGLLAGRLGDGKRSVQVFARAGAAEEVEVEGRALDIRLLREHHLMDVQG